MPILADTLIAEESTEYQVVKRDPNQQNYRDRVQLFVREHQNHVTIRRLKNKEPVTPTDIAPLEIILFALDGPIPQDEYQKIYGKEPLGKLRCARLSVWIATRLKPCLPNF
ncbi:MAG: hypothetical protein IPP22_04485 [Nitrosomonas sp.]|nr:hypothetical protein [Nitrosomonas sp.]